MQKKLLINKESKITKNFNFDILKFKRAHKNSVLSCQVSKPDIVTQRKAKNNKLSFRKEVGFDQNEFILIKIES